MQDDNIELPRIANILKSWSISESPRKRAFLVICCLHRNMLHAQMCILILKVSRLKQSKNVIY